MALTESTENDKIEIVRKWNVQIRKATVIKRDGEEISRTFNRRTITPGKLDASDNLIERDISGEDADVRAICNAVWTQSIKDAYKAHLIAIKPS
tara:strand:- start:46 stop:327 length:282 start_codon:yes stop_codon:yes gene_type:complete